MSKYLKAFKALCDKATKMPLRYKEDRSEVPYHGIYGPPHPVDGGDYAPIARASSRSDARLLTLAANNVKALVEALTVQSEMCDCTGGCHVCKSSWALLAKIEEESQ